MPSCTIVVHKVYLPSTIMNSNSFARRRGHKLNLQTATAVFLQIYMPRQKAGDILISCWRNSDSCCCCCCCSAFIFPATFFAYRHLNTSDSKSFAPFSSDWRRISRLCFYSRVDCRHSRCRSSSDFIVITPFGLCCYLSSFFRLWYIAWFSFAHFPPILWI